ncbi:MAG TPA: SDR family oxidoreductase [Polyangium sp.]|nr:SDR family oxidoreductase [Polyangium sp.]
MSELRTALVLGGTGYVGREVVRGLVREGVRVAFTYRTQEEAAQALVTETGAHAYPTNLSETNPIRELFAKLTQDARKPDILVHTAVLACRASTLNVADALADEMYAVNVRSVLIAIQSFVAGLAGQPADVILTASQAGITKLPASPAFAATQSARLGLTHALARELGSSGIRINLVLLGLLAGGISADIDPARRADYEKFSAFARVGTATEAAKAIVRLALTNRWMTGSVLPLTGGL